MKNKNTTNQSRKLWMAPRNIRAIPPWKLIEILEVFKQASLEGHWDENIRSLLQAKGLKKDFLSYDKNPGGDRTYKAQLICLGLIYENINKEIEFTKAGKDFLNSHEEVLLILRRLLLRQQYPSVYSSGQNVNICSSIQVKPILFLLHLVKKLYEKDPDQGYLVKEEIAIAVIYGHNFNCLEKCYKKIQKIRSDVPLKDLIDKDEDLWTKRTIKTSFSKKIENILDIANTFDNWMHSAQLIIRVPDGNKNKSFYNPDLENLISSESINLIEKKLQTIKNDPISFQKRYGAWDGRKDTSNNNNNISNKLTAEETILKNKFFEAMSSSIFSEKDIVTFKKKMLSMGFSEKSIEVTIGKYNKFNMTLFENYYIELATGGKEKGLEFEKATLRLIEKLDLDARLTGQLRREKNSRGSYADIIVTKEQDAIIIDTKASSKYDLPSQDHSKACQNYIPNWKELNHVHKVTNAIKLNALCYIAGGFHPIKTFKLKLEEVKKETGINVCAIKAWDLYKYIQKNEHSSASDFMQKLKVTDIVDLMN